jgi:hypothetical protein
VIERFSIRVIMLRNHSVTTPRRHTTAPRSDHFIAATHGDAVTKSRHHTVIR